MSDREWQALEDKGIKVGSIVRTAFRGGVRQGPVREVTDQPRVVFTRKRKGQPDKDVVHKASTLEKVSEEEEDDDNEGLQKARSAKTRSSTARAKGSGGVQNKQGQAEQPGLPKTPIKAARRSTRGSEKGKGQASKRSPASKPKPTSPSASQSKPSKRKGSGGGGRRGKRART